SDLGLRLVSTADADIDRWTDRKRDVRNRRDHEWRLERDRQLVGGGLVAVARRRRCHDGDSAAGPNAKRRVEHVRKPTRGANRNAVVVSRSWSACPSASNEPESVNIPIAAPMLTPSVT